MILQNASDRSQWTLVLPVDTVYTVFQGHQKPLPHRKLQVFCLRDDQHVWARQGGAEVVQVDPAVVGHQTHTDVTILPTQNEETLKIAAWKPVCWSFSLALHLFPKLNRERCVWACLTSSAMWAEWVFVVLQTPNVLLSPRTQTHLWLGAGQQVPPETSTTIKRNEIQVDWIVGFHF